MVSLETEVQTVWTPGHGACRKRYMSTETMREEIEITVRHSIDMIDRMQYRSENMRHGLLVGIVVPMSLVISAAVPGASHLTGSGSYTRRQAESGGTVYGQSCA